MSRLLRFSAVVLLFLESASLAAADEAPDTLRDRIQQTLDDPELSTAERFQALRDVLDEEETTYLTENAEIWVAALGSTDFETRVQARRHLTHAGVRALAALEHGFRSRDLETSRFCQQRLDELARSDEYSQAVISALERLANDDHKATAATAATLLAAVREFQAEQIRQAAIDKIIRVGGQVYFDERQPGRPVNRVMFMMGDRIDDTIIESVTKLTQLQYLHAYRTNITDVGLTQLASLKNLENLDLSYSPITDQGLAILAKLSNLKDLSVAGTNITDAGLRHLMDLKKLNHLRLSGTQITDIGLMGLQELPNLDRLSLGMRGSITDAGLRHLQGFPRLRSLYLSRDFTDAGLQHLAKVKALERLSVSLCEEVTDVGISELQKSRPDLNITYRASMMRRPVHRQLPVGGPPKRELPAPPEPALPKRR